MPVPLRADFDARSVRAAAKRSKDGPQARRLLALAAIYEGTTRSEAAKIGGGTLQIGRDWVVKCNARGPEGLIDRKAPGQPARLNDTHRAALAEIIERGPMPAVHGVVRATTGCQTVSSNPTTTSSIIAVTHGTNSSICPGKSCPSVCATGRIGSSQRDLDINSCRHRIVHLLHGRSNELFVYCLPSFFVF